MTSEQIQKISELTMIASKENDIESLIKLSKIVDQSESESEFTTITGAEWFESLLTGEQLMAVNNFV
jgi:Asp-tRNA(Asn)/Glu-tRNA(Gln) amidotransferase C subunit